MWDLGYAEGYTATPFFFLVQKNESFPLKNMMSDQEGKKELELQRRQVFYKIISGDNRSYHGNFEYKLGLNALADHGEEFDPEPRCGPGGLYFCVIERIFDWLVFGVQVCELTIPDDARVVAVGNKFKADKIFIERIFPVDLEELSQLGAGLVIRVACLMAWGVRARNLEVVKSVIKFSVKSDRGKIFDIAFDNNNLEAAELMLKYGINSIDARFWQSICRNKLEMAKLLIKYKGNEVDHESAMRVALNHYNLDAVKLLIESGAQLRNIYSWQLKILRKNRRFELLKYIISLHPLPSRAYLRLRYRMW